MWIPRGNASVYQLDLDDPLRRLAWHEPGELGAMRELLTRPGRSATGRTPLSKQVADTRTVKIPVSGGCPLRSRASLFGDTRCSTDEQDITVGNAAGWVRCFQTRLRPLAGLDHA
jgi:hypothetical protein